MPTKRIRFVAVASALALAVMGLTATTATADEPVWTEVPGSAVTTSEYSIALQTTPDVGGLYATNDPVPGLNVVFTNLTDHELRLGWAVDLFEQGVLNAIWKPETWPPGTNVSLEDLSDSFAQRVAPGATLENMQVPQWPGRTVGFYVLDDHSGLGPIPGCVPESEGGAAGETCVRPPVAPEVLAASFAVPGGFVPVRYDAQFSYQWSADVPFAMGQEVTIAGEGQSLFPGAQATVTTSGLQAGASYEMWLAPDADFFFLQLGGGALPQGAVNVGSATVAADGTVSTTITIPSDTPLYGNYNLIMGNSATRYWPAGGWKLFPVTQPDAQTVLATGDGESSDTADFGPTHVGLTFPAGTVGGTTTISTSATGPVASGFVLASSPPLYYHIESTAVPGGQVEVCVSYDPLNLPGGIPNLYHYVAVGGGYQWQNITTSRTAGQVCGLTSSYSPFVLGYGIDGAVTAPAVGVLTHDNGLDNGLQDGSYQVTMTLSEGENATAVRLLENGAVIAEQELVFDTPNAQQAVFPITGRANGTYVYTAELENSRGVTVTAPLTVTVTQANPGKVWLAALGLHKAGTTVLFTGVMPWGTNGTAWRLLQNGIEVKSGSLTAHTPYPQGILTSLKLAKGTYTFTLELSNALGATVSNTVVWKVT